MNARFASGQEDAKNEENVQETARRLGRDLARAKAEGEVADTDPRAVAARLAAELAQEDREGQK